MHSSYAQLTLSPKGLMLAGNLLAKRTPKGELAIEGQEAKIQALLIAAYGKPVSPRVMNLIKRAGALFAEVQENDWDNRTPHQPNQIPPLAKAQMMLALAGLGSMEEENVPQLAKTLRALHKGVPAHKLLKAYLRKDDSEDDDEEDDDNEDDDTSSGDGSSSGGGGNYNPDEPRDWHGRWTTGGISTAQTPDDSAPDAASTNNTSSNNSAAAPSQPTQPADTSSGNGGSNNSSPAPSDNPPQAAPVNSGAKDSNANNAPYNTAPQPTPTPPEQAHPVIVTLDNGNIVTDTNFPYAPLVMPSNVSLSANVDFGHALASLPSVITGAEGDSDGLSSRETAMIAAFMPNGSMDYQRTYSTQTDSDGNPLINKTYIDFGNYNFGVVAAAAGYSLDQALDAAAIVNARNVISSPLSDAYGTLFGGNPRNNKFIRLGYQDYTSGKIKGSAN